MIRTAALALVAVSAASPAAAADRNFGVSGFDRIRVEGPFKVRVTTGVPPFARASGSLGGLERVSLEVQGRTLVVRGNRSAWGGYPGEAAGPVEIAIGTHELSAAWLNGAGSIAIDRVRGAAFDLSVQGSGSARIGEVAVDQLKVSLAGTGGAGLAGSALKLTTMVRGISTLESAALNVKDASIVADGPATVRLNVAGTATVKVRGSASVELSGGPSCIVTSQGSASVTGCN